MTIIHVRLLQPSFLALRWQIESFLLLLLSSSESGQTIIIQRNRFESRLELFGFFGSESVGERSIVQCTGNIGVTQWEDAFHRSIFFFININSSNDRNIGRCRRKQWKLQSGKHWYRWIPLRKQFKSQRHRFVLQSIRTRGTNTIELAQRQFRSSSPAFTNASGTGQITDGRLKQLIILITILLISLFLSLSPRSPIVHLLSQILSRRKFSLEKWTFETIEESEKSRSCCRESGQSQSSSPLPHLPSLSLF